jgi:hypothetical protein
MGRASRVRSVHRAVLSTLRRLSDGNIHVSRNNVVLSPGTRISYVAGPEGKLILVRGTKSAGGSLELSATK